MGEVYLARDPQIDRRLAVKTLRLAGISEAELTARKQRLLREARTAGRLIHPNVVTLFDAGEQDGLLFLAFEYVPGSDLSVRLGSGPLPVGEALRIARETCAGLAHAHRHDVVHRDVKPSNLLLDADGRVKISDFGIAKVSNETSELTLTGTVMGSPHYMSPEQIRGEELDGRSDLFSLGVVLYEMISGRRPFAGETLTTLVYQILSTEPPELPPLAPGLDPRLPALLARLLAKDREKRLSDAATAGAEIAALEAELAPPVLRAPAVEASGPDDRTRALPSGEQTEGNAGSTGGGAPGPPPPPAPAPSAPLGAAPPVPPPPSPRASAATPSEAGEGSYAVPSLGGSRRRTALVAALVVALLLAAGLLGVLFLRGGDGGEGEGGGEGAVAQAQEPPLPEPVVGEEETAGGEPDATPEPEATLEPESEEAEDAAPAPDAPEATAPAGARTTPPRQAVPAPSTPPRGRPQPEPVTEIRRPAPEREPRPATPPTATLPTAADEPATEPTAAEPAPPPVRAELDTGLRVHFDVAPPDAFVLVDGTVVGRAAELSSRSGRAYTLPGPGRHRVTLRRDGMEDVHLALDADAARPGVTPVRARMNRLAAAETPLHELEMHRVREGIVLRVEPANARVLVDGEPRGLANRYSGGAGPFRRGEVLELPLGVHRVTLMAPGRRRVDFAVDVTAGATRDRQRVEITLPPLPAGVDE